MRNIRKGKEPSCLGAHRATPHASYGNLTSECKRELVRRMLEEQGHLCCYCMTRIGAHSCTIEHWLPQAVSKGKRTGLSLDYGNMLVVCGGGEGTGESHCDKAKKEKTIKFNPSDPAHNIEALLSFHANGKVVCEKDRVFSGQIETVLNLNAERLVQNRRRAMRTALEQLHNMSVQELRTMRKRFVVPDSLGRLPEYCIAIVYMLDKKIKKQDAIQKNTGR